MLAADQAKVHELIDQMRQELASPAPRQQVIDMLSHAMVFQVRQAALPQISALTDHIAH